MNYVLATVLLAGYVNFNVIQEDAITDGDKSIIRRIQANGAYYLKAIPKSFNKGDVGVLADFNNTSYSPAALKVAQVIDGTNMRVLVQAVSKPGITRANGLSTPPEIYSYDIWVEGIDTSKFSDGTPIDERRKFVVENVGTKQYNSNGGLRTIPHFKITKQCKHIIEIQDKVFAGEFDDVFAPFEVWQDKDGAKLKARFVSFSKGILTLETSEGKTIEIESKKLHKDSRKLAIKSRTKFAKKKN